MSNALVKVDKSFSKDCNFWDLNPALIYMKPFSELYQRDKSKDKKTSSNEMWIVFYMEDADEEENKFYRIPREERMEMLFENFNCKIDFDDSIFKECLRQYSTLCLSSTERTLKEQKDFLTKRSESITKMEYTLDTMKEIDNALSRNLKIYEDFKKIEEMFSRTKKEQKARGGRALMASEKGLL